MHGLILVACIVIPAVKASCTLLQDETGKPKGLEERALDSEVVLAAYTRAVYNNLRNSSFNYSAEFLVFNILKGEESVVELYQRRKPSSLETALNRRLVNASDFGDPSKCHSNVKPGETYILFLDVLTDGRLSARYDGVYGPAVIYSRDKELALEAIATRPWSEWSPCSGTCGGGIQQRRRVCDSTTTQCSSDEGQQRTCNMFPCHGILNILEEAGVHRSALRPSGRPTAYKLLPSGSWRSREEEVFFPRAFPWEFSLLVTVRVKQGSSGGFLLRVLHRGSLQVGLYMSDTLTLVLSDKDNIRVSFVKSLFDDSWHQMAFSVKRNTVSFYLNCEFSGKLPIPGKIRPFGGHPATVVVGSTGQQELDAFQGDVEQITISGSPDDAEKQCNLTTRPLNLRTGGREEVRSRPLAWAGTQNDQLPLRGDIIDDEDFIFDDAGSGHHGNVDDDEYEYDDEDHDTTKEKDAVFTKIPLKSDNDDSSEDDDDESESDESHDEESDEDSSSYEDDYDYNHPDEEPDKSDDEEGSGAGSQFELAWSEWSPCSSTCNWGRRTRTSYCLDNGLNLERCTEASSKRSETEACFVRLCPTTSTTTTTISQLTTAVVPKKAECKVTCLNGGTCQPPRSCLCPKDHYGYLCQYEKPSCKVTCRNGGTCQPPSTCICAKGFFGKECQYGCGQPCPKGAKCLQETSCKCPPGYMPPTCIALCKPSCLNGGACVAPNVCRCKPGYVGKSCHKAICEQGCKNGGECVAPNKCACRSGFTGKDCSKPLCNPKCQNGGECVKPYFCHCPLGTKGALCEKLLCNPGCRNGGKCIGPNKCSCPRGYSGAYCDKAYCPGGCINGGKCGKTGKCSCLPGYTGLHCEKKKPCKFVEVKEPYKRGFKQKVTTQVKVPCGAWGWKTCTKIKVHYEMVYKTFFRTSYKCEDVQKNFPSYQKMISSRKTG